MASAAWTRKAGKSPSGGLNAKGRASYKKGKGIRKLKKVAPQVAKRMGYKKGRKVK